MIQPPLAAQLPAGRITARIELQLGAGRAGMRLGLGDAELARAAACDQTQLHLLAAAVELAALELGVDHQMQGQGGAGSLGWRRRGGLG